MLAPVDLACIQDKPAGRRIVVDHQVLQRVALVRMDARVVRRIDLPGSIAVRHHIGRHRPVEILVTDFLRQEARFPVVHRKIRSQAQHDHEPQNGRHVQTTQPQRFQELIHQAHQPAKQNDQEHITVKRRNIRRDTAFGHIHVFQVETDQDARRKRTDRHHGKMALELHTLRHHRQYQAKSTRHEKCFCHTGDRNAVEELCERDAFCLVEPVHGFQREKRDAELVNGFGAVERLVQIEREPLVRRRIVVLPDRVRDRVRGGAEELRQDQEQHVAAEFQETLLLPADEKTRGHAEDQHEHEECFVDHAGRKIEHAGEDLILLAFALVKSKEIVQCQEEQSDRDLVAQCVCDEKIVLRRDGRKRHKTDRAKIRKRPVDVLADEIPHRPDIEKNG